MLQSPPASPNLTDLPIRASTAICTPDDGILSLSGVRSRRIPPPIFVPSTGSDSMARTSRLATFMILGLWLLACLASRMNPPVPRRRGKFSKPSNAPSNTYRTKRDWLSTRTRRLPSRADAALGLERSRTAGVRDRQRILGEHDRVFAGQQGQVARLKDLPQPGRSARPASAGPGTEHGTSLPGRRGTVIARAEGGTETKPEADHGRNHQEATARWFVGVLRNAQATTDQRKPDHRRGLDHHGT